MGNCRLVILIAFEAWKEEVTKVNMYRADNWLRTKALLVARLEEQIKEVKLRLSC